MEFSAVLKGRRSIRKYKDTPISDEDIRAIIDAALMAPSGMNMQPWFFSIIKDHAIMHELKELMESGSASFVKQLQERFPTHPEVVRDTKSFIETFGGAPVVIIAFLKKPDYTGNRLSTMTQSVAAAIENMLLTAYDRGIGSCWLTAPNDIGISEVLRERFAPDKGSFVGLITLGFADESPNMPRRHEGFYEIF